MPRARTDALWIGAILLLGLAVRLEFLYRTNFVIDADEAIVGLMAKHILEGSAWPVFYYGQEYMGSLEPILTAALFGMFRISGVVLKGVPLLFSIVLLAEIYILARAYTSRSGARIAAFLAAVGPHMFVHWGTKARGGFIEIVAIGTLGLIIAVQLLRKNQLRPRESFILGVVFGFGWWVNNQVIFFIVPTALVVLGRFLPLIGISAFVRVTLAGAIGFFVGGAPFWYFNFTSTPRFQSFAVLARSAGSWWDIVRHLEGYFEQAIPIIVGARHAWWRTDIFPQATLLGYCLYITIVGVVVYQWISGPDGLLRVQSRFSPTRRPFGLLLLFLVTTPLVFAMSKFGWLSLEPRYLLPLYPVLFVMVGTAVSSLWNSGLAGTKALSIALFSLLLFIHSVSLYGGDGAIPGQPFAIPPDRVSRDQRELYTWLQDNGYAHIFTSYWIGYRAAFETNEKVTFSRYRGPQTVRIHAYERHGRNFRENPVYILGAVEGSMVSKALAQLGYEFRMTPVSGYIALDHLRPTEARGAKIRIHPEEITSSHQQATVGRMVDGDLGSRWATSAPQSPGMTIEIQFTTPPTISGLEIDYGFWRHDFPRGLLIEFKSTDGTWCSLLNTTGDPAYAHVFEGERVWRMYFTPRRVKALRFTQLGHDAIFDWSMSELSLFAPLEVKEPPNEPEEEG